MTDCKSYTIGPNKEGRKYTLTTHCHAEPEGYWYEISYPMENGIVTSVCSEYWWPDSEHAMAAALGRFVDIDRPLASGEKWDDRMIDGATKRR